MGEGSSLGHIDKNSSDLRSHFVCALVYNVHTHGGTTVFPFLSGLKEGIVIFC